jgi:hypothetical protein
MANYREEARKAARRHGLNPDIFERQINQESGFSQDVITGRRRSSAGAQGIAQFMPATARGLGINPLNPTQALDGAARLMSSYIKKYGNYKDALVAYNAGPGGVGHPPAESRNYVKSILGGKNPTVGKNRQSLSSGRGGGSIITPGVSLPSTSRTVNDPAAEARVIAASFLAQRNPNNLLLRLGILNPNEATTRTVTTPGINIPTTRTNISSSSSSSGRGSGGAKLSGGHSGLFELIHNTGNGPGFAVKDGQKVDGRQVYSSVWDGHRDHVHIAAGPNTVVKLGKLAQEMGLHVGENPHFGGVTPVHVKDSYHYKGEAIDVSGDPHKMNRFSRRVEQIFGLH